MVIRAAARWILFVLALPCARVTAAEHTENPGPAVRALIDQWYVELRQGREGHLSNLLARGSVIAPTYQEPRTDRPQPAVMDWTRPPYPHFLAVRAQKFAHEVETLRIEGTLAKVQVWERGWIWAWAAEQTYENAAAALFILEHHEGEGWKILVYHSEGRAVHPKHANDPLPDLRPR